MARMRYAKRVMKEIAPRITVDPKVKFGKPVVKGTRVPVDLVLAQLSSGMTSEQVCEEYAIEKSDVLAVLAYAAKSLGNEQVRAIA
jgi:uncharacterized protein (DUF433 family)